MLELDAVEARILGSLIEKAVTTPDQYPLTFQALMASCNQKTSREPVMNLDAETLDRGLRGLSDKKLAERLHVPGSRVPKFRHHVENLLSLPSMQEVGVVCVLLLRGPQTPGELKGRTDRLCKFENGTAEVEGLLQDLCTRKDGPVVTRLARQPGQKETRYQHLFSGPAPSEAEAAVSPAPAADRLSLLENRIEELERRIQRLEEPPLAAS